MFKKFGLCFLFLMIVGCSSVPYIPPKEGPVATLIIPAKTSNYKFFGGSSTTFVRFAVVGEDGCGSLYAIDDVPEGQETVQYTIPVSSDLILNYTAGIGNRLCSVTASMTPEKGKIYVVSALITNYCSLYVRDRSGANEVAVKLKKASVDPLMGKKVCKEK